MKNSKVQNYSVAIISAISVFISSCNCTDNSACIPERNKSQGTPQKTAIQSMTIDNKSSKGPQLDVRHGGRLVITRSEVFYVRNGSVVWTSSGANRYQRLNGHYYVATYDYVFCTRDNGSVIWRTKLPNKGSCTIRDNILYVLTKTSEIPLNINTGKMHL